MLADLQSYIEGSNSTKGWFFACKLIVVHRHFCQVQGHLLDKVLLTFGRVAFCGQVLLFFFFEGCVSCVSDIHHLLQVNFEEVEDRWGWDLVVDGLQDIQLNCLDLLNCQLLVGDLLVDHLHLQREDVFVLGGHEHAGDSKDVQVRNLSRILLVLEVPVHQAHSQEEGLIVALEVSEDFNHPVNHSSSQNWGNFVLDETVSGQQLLFKFTNVQVDRFAIFYIDIDVLSLKLASGLP